LASLEQHLFGPGQPGEALWRKGLLTRLLADPALSARHASLLAAIASPQALKDYLMGARTQGDAKRRAQRCMDAVAEALRMGPPA
jgi:hypothetical protein